MLVTFKDGTVKEYRGFMGEGAYYLKYNSDVTFTKITLTNAMNDRITGYDATYDPKRLPKKIYGRFVCL